MSDAEQRQRARATWAAGDFDAIAERIWHVGDDLVGRVGVNDGEAVLDVACGTGNAAIPAAVAGAKVTGLDITPELFEDGRRRAAEAGVEIDWVEGDAEDAAVRRRELRRRALDLRLHVRARTTRSPPPRSRASLKPGGRIGVAAWRPEGSIGQFFQTISKHAPAPAARLSAAAALGRARPRRVALCQHARRGQRSRMPPPTCDFDSVEHMFEEYATKFGPVVVLRAALEAEGRWEALRDDMVALYEQTTRPEDGGVAFDADYLITLGERAE